MSTGFNFTTPAATPAATGGFSFGGSVRSVPCAPAAPAFKGFTFTPPAPAKTNAATGFSFGATPTPAPSFKGFTFSSTPAASATAPTLAPSFSFATKKGETRLAKAEKAVSSSSLFQLPPRDVPWLPQYSCLTALMVTLAAAKSAADAAAAADAAVTLAKARKALNDAETASARVNINSAGKANAPCFAPWIVTHRNLSATNVTLSAASSAASFASAAEASITTAKITRAVMDATQALLDVEIASRKTILAAACISTKIRTNAVKVMQLWSRQRAHSKQHGERAHLQISALKQLQGFYRTKGITKEELQHHQSTVIDMNFSAAGTGSLNSICSLKKYILDFTRSAAQRKRTAAESAKALAECDEIAQLATLPSTLNLQTRLGWQASVTPVFCSFLQKLNGTVGLEPVKQYIRSVESDAVGRYALSETHKMRHVMIEGDFGVGKRTGAELIAQVVRVLWSTDGRLVTSDLSASTTTTPVVEAKSLKEIVDDIGIAKHTVYYIRVSSGSTKPNNLNDGPILEQIQQSNSIVIFAGEKKFMDAFAKTVDVLRKRTPSRIVLPSVNADDLAHITAQLARQQGYKLLRHDEGNAKSLAKMADTSLATDARVMRYIISQRYTADTIKDRNAYLAQDMLELAIVRKNERLRTDKDKTDNFGQMVLTAADFDVKLLSKDERDARRRAVDKQIATMVGWDTQP